MKDAAARQAGKLSSHKKHRLLQSLLLVISLVFLLIVPAVKATAGLNQWTTYGPSSGYVAAVAVSPNYGADNTVFAGNFNGNGVYKSINGGIGWTPVNTNITGDGLYVNAIAVSPDYAADQTVYAGSNGGVYKSTDGGASWTAADTGITGYGVYVYSLAMSPNYATDQTIYAGSNGGGVYKSTDGGTSWTTMNTGIENININALAVSPNYAADQTVYAGSYTGSGVYKSTDGGMSWTAVNTGLTDTNISTLAISPSYSTDQTVYAGTPSGGVFKSMDGGASWTAVNTGITSTNISALALSPGYATDQTIYAGSPAGSVYRSMDGGAGWTAVNNGIENQNIYALAVSPNYTMDKTVYAGSNGGVWSYTDNPDTTPPTVGISPATKITNSQFLATATASDSDSPSLTYSWSQLSGPGTITFSSPTALSTMVSASADGTYTLQFTATDAAGNSASSTMTLTWDIVPPVNNAGPDKTANAQFTQTATATDAVSGVAGVSWSKVSGPGTVTFGSPAALSTTISASADGTYTLQFTATDTAGNSAASTMTLTWDATPPTVSAGPNKTANAQFTQTATATDAVSGVASVSWSKVSGPGTVTFGSPAELSTTISAGTEGVYTLRVTATDAAGNSASSTMTLTWDTTTPVVSAGSNKTKNAQFTQTATATDASSMTYSWNKASGPGTVTFGSPTALSTTISASTDGTYTLQFTATDAAGNFSSSTMTLVWDTTLPTVSAGPDMTTYSQFTQTATAADANTMTYSWSKVSGPGTITFGSPASLSTAISASVVGPYVIQFTATDAAGNSASSTMGLTWIAPPPVSSITAPADGAVIGGAVYTITGTATATGMKQVEVGITPEGGTTGWSIATGTSSWSYVWTLPGDGNYTIQSRATNENDIVETPGQGVTVTVSSSVMVKTVSAWGNNAKGQLGTGSTTPSYIPVSVIGLTDVIAIAAGYYHTESVKGGAVWSWGGNTYGQLGDGTTTERHSPVSVSGLSGVSAVACGYYNTIALKSDGTVWAWGANYASQIGDGTTTDRHSPVAVSGLSGAVAVASGCYHHTVALRTDGTVWTWGGNYSGELGDGTTTNRTTPVQVKLQGGAALSGVIAIAGGSDHTLALKSNGTVWAWGYNLYGQLGDGTTTERHNPVAVSGLTGVIAIASGENHSIAVKSDGTVWAWGYNAYGGLGDGTTTNRSAPVQVKLQDGTPLAGVASVAGGPDYTVACKIDGTVWAWGGNYYGQLGDGTTNERHYPAAVSSLSSAVAVSGGGAHAAALRYIMDTTPPSSVITEPSNNAALMGVLCQVSGTATGSAGATSVRKVEVGITPSGGSTTWYTASGTGTWSYSWVLPISGSFNVKSRATSLAGIIEEPLAGVNVTVTAYGIPELQHANWDASFTNGNCNLWDVTAGTFLSPAIGSLVYTLKPSLCQSCHNAAGVAYDRRLAGKDHYMTLPVVIPDYLVCTSCHDPLSKSEDYGRTWEMTTTNDHITFTLQRGGWTVYGRQTPVVYRDTATWNGGSPTYSKTKKRYKVDPSEYTYNETAGTVTFKTQQDLTTFIYVSLDYPYLKASSKDNRLCLQCHTAQITHKDNNCLACHSAHDTDNNMNIRQSVRTPDYTTITVKFLRYTGTNSFADGDSTRDGICEVCHTTTRYYRRDGSGFINHSGGLNYNGTDCTTCHSHSTGFAR